MARAASCSSGSRVHWLLYASATSAVFTQGSGVMELAPRCQQPCKMLRIFGTGRCAGLWSAAYAVEGTASLSSHPGALALTRWPAWIVRHDLLAVATPPLPPTRVSSSESGTL